MENSKGALEHPRRMDRGTEDLEESNLRRGRAAHLVMTAGRLQEAPAGADRGDHRDDQEGVSRMNVSK